MRLDAVNISIRERSHAETLDLAVFVVRRHWVGLGVAFVAGVLPFALLNRWLFHEGDSTFGYFLVLLMEIPWATAPITLYLGQATFLERVSVKRIVLDFLGSIGQIILIQTLLRGLCVVFGFALIPLAILVFRFKFANEIVLLERGTWRQTLRRNGGFHAKIGGRLASETAIDLLLAVFLTLVVTHGARSFSQAMRDDWESSFDWTDSIFEGWFEGLYPAFSWEGQFAIWLTIGFFTVANYLSYLDCRIRREGWEVELKMIAQGARLAREAW